jgi:hypothetical protein
MRCVVSIDRTSATIHSVTIHPASVHPAAVQTVAVDEVLRLREERLWSTRNGDTHGGFVGSVPAIFRERPARHQDKENSYDAYALATRHLHCRAIRNVKRYRRECSDCERGVRLNLATAYSHL